MEAEQILGAVAFGGEGRRAIEPVNRRIERRAEQAEPACIGREAPFQRKKYGRIAE
jgi:hypothetical protein